MRSLCRFGPGAACIAWVLVAAMGDGAAARGLTTLYNFTAGADGGYPEAPLVYHAGLLFGTTNIGGADGAGTVFALDAATGRETVLHGFTGGIDGGNPVTGLLYDSGFLYGTTFAGGALGQGVVFKVNARSGDETVLHNFKPGVDPGSGHSGLILCNGRLYGTTYGDGPAGRGTVFRVDPVSGRSAVIYGFAGRGDGANPIGGLVSAGHVLYGTTVYGGTSGNGTVFKLDLATRAETVLHSFAGGSDGANPNAQLIVWRGALYGTSFVGGTFDKGTVFKVDPVTDHETTLHSFGGNGKINSVLGDGANPLAGVTQVGNILFGTTSGGVACEFGTACGTVFQLDLASGQEAVGYHFTDGPGGGRPYAELIYQNGAFYGTTSIGGASAWGTVFRFVP